MRSVRRDTLYFALFLLIVGATASGVVTDLVARSVSDGLASYVVLIPFVTLALIVWDRDSIFASARRDAKAGAVLILMGFVILLAAYYAFAGVTVPTLLSLRVSGLVVIVLGGFRFFYGPDAFRVALFPLSFLGFTVPLPPAVVAVATTALKAGSAEAVNALFAVSGTPYHRDGFVFSLPNVAIEIADECSGIRSSIGLLLTMLLGGHAFLRQTWTKSVIFLAVFPIAILKNGIRIVTLTLLAVHVDPGFLDGQLHHEGGIVFFLIALVMLMPVLFWLQRAETRRDRKREAVLVLSRSGN